MTESRPFDLPRWRQTFSLFDQDGIGMISLSDFGCLLRCLDYNPTELQVSEILNAIDSDGSGMMAFHEFVALMHGHAHKLAPVKNDLKMIEGLFRSFDPYHTGSIQAQHLARLLTEYGEPFAMIDAQAFMQELTFTSDERIEIKDLIQHCVDTSSIQVDDSID